MGRFALTAVGIGMLLMIVMGMGGIYRGIIEDATLLIHKLDAELWVVQRSTRGPFAEVSRLPPNLVDRVASVSGVADTRKFVFHTIQREHRGKPLRMAVLGLDWPTDRGEWLPLMAGPPTAGQIAIGGQPVMDRTRALVNLRTLRRRHIGFIFQKSNQYPAMLSGGQQQRVAVARALANQPQVILADEPTAALDSHRGRQVMELFRKVAHEQGGGVIVVTHDQRSLHVFDTIYEMQDGRVFRAATPSQVPA